MNAHLEPQASAALDRLIREQGVELARLARRAGLRAEDALDCVHDAVCTFLQIALRDGLPAVSSEPGPLLRGMVLNAARNKRRRHHLARPHREAAAGLDPDPAPSAEALVARAEDCVRLRGCVDRLSARQRMVVMMRLLEERGGDDVATALGLTRGHVDVLLHRAKASLVECMAGAS